MTEAERLTLRPLEGPEDYALCLQLQQGTWGQQFRELVPPAMLMIGAKMGGVAAGAFSARGDLIGFVYGITGPRDGIVSHWSHMLAVREDYRDKGVGRQLKEFQRRELMAIGVPTMYWTFDPLVARNAFLNVTRLGVEVIEYCPDLYGSNETSQVDSVIGTDRFVVRWDLAQDRPSRPNDGEGDDPSGTFIIDIDREASVETPVQVSPYDTYPVAYVAIPRDIHQLKLADPVSAQAWRRHTRQTFQWYLTRCYRVTRFNRRGDGRGVYVLRSPTDPGPT